jgi:hypothetical protein
MTIAVVKEILIKGAKRFLKVQEYGVKTADVVADFGDDSAPLKDMIAIYSKTAIAGEEIIIGYINSNQIAQPGEKRIFSLMPDGSLSFDIYLRNDGTCEIGGNVDNAVRYLALNTALQLQVQAINAQLTAISLAIAGVGGTYTPAPITLDLTSAKIEEVKTS